MRIAKVNLAGRESPDWTPSGGYIVNREEKKNRPACTAGRNPKLTMKYNEPILLHPRRRTSDKEAAGIPR